MKQRKMYLTHTQAQDLWEREPAGGSTIWFTSTGSPHPVLVTDATDMPDFAPGDRVTWGSALHPADVMGAPIFIDGQWHVPVRVPFCMPQLVRASILTKLPREKTVTLRVTGVLPGSKLAREIDEVVERWEDFYGISIDMLERVEDES